jgi:signal transduction histidine kinase
VKDKGAGIPAAIRDRILEPFFSTKQFGTLGTSHRSGTGIKISARDRHQINRAGGN